QRDAEEQAASKKAEETAKAAREAEAKEKAAATLIDLKAKLTAAQEEADRATQQATQARREATEAAKKVVQAEGNYRASTPRWSAPPAAAHSAAGYDTALYSPPREAACSGADWGVWCPSRSASSPRRRRR